MIKCLFSKLTIGLNLAVYYLFVAVEASPGVDPEGIEVAKQCLSDVFKINYPIDSPSTDSLVEIFRLKDVAEQCDNKSNLTHNQSTDARSTSAARDKVDANYAVALNIWFIL